MAQPVPVRHVEGTLHGFLSLRAQDGHIVAYGDLAQIARGNTVTAHMVFHFRDGSVDDETTVFTERGTFRLIGDHHTQQGPSFPKPMDLTIDVVHGRVTSHAKDKDGKDEVQTYSLSLPPDLANGMVGIVAKNIGTNVETKVPMLVMAPKPRLITLAFDGVGEDPYTFLGSQRKGTHFHIQLQLGGVTGVVATLIGKHPPDIDMWILGGDAPTFLREQGPFFQDGPIWTMELASPDWPEAAHPAP
jgi:hypothetical protein